eukprot:350344-Chlamydomonas_euryale.AAC.1
MQHAFVAAWLHGACGMWATMHAWPGACSMHVEVACAVHVPGKVCASAPQPCPLHPGGCEI